MDTEGDQADDTGKGGSVNYLLSVIFSAACDRHFDHCRPGGDYEVCRHWRYRLAWGLENWLWYGGRR